MVRRKDPQLRFTGLELAEALSGRPLVPRDSIYYALSEADDIFRDEDFATAYSRVGRPAISPGMLIKVLLLQQLEGVWDREAEARARYDLRWKVALGIGLEEAGFDSTTLSVFRTRLLLNQLDELVFRRMLEAAVERGLISGRLAEQVIDSTHTLGAGAVQDTYTLIQRP